MTWEGSSSLFRLRGPLVVRVLVTRSLFRGPLLRLLLGWVSRSAGFPRFQRDLLLPLRPGVELPLEGPPFIHRVDATLSCRRTVAPLLHLCSLT